MRLGLSLIATFVASVIPLCGGLAQGPASAFDRPSIGLTATERLATVDVQKALIWTGHYNSMADGDFGKLTKAGAAAWQRTRGYVADGELTQTQVSQLIVEGRRIRDSWQWGTFIEDGVGFSAGYSARLFRLERRTEHGGAQFISEIADANFSISVYPWSGGFNFEGIVGAIASSSGPRVVEYTARGSNWVVAVGTSSGRSFYTRAEARPSGFVTFIVSVRRDQRDMLSPVVTAMANSFQVGRDIRLGNVAPIQPRRPPPTWWERDPIPLPPPQADRRPAAPAEPSVIVGTAFYVSADGFLVTNSHVVGSCREVVLKRRGLLIGRASLFARNERDDLAVLKHDASSPSYLRVRAGDPLRVADAVVVFGYPLSGMLSTTGNTTVGNVTALAGLRDDYRMFQLSAPVQPGNSGGPVVDDRGRLIGVVVSKLDALKFAGVTGDIPQNVNFAIKASTLVSFLEAQGVRYESAATGEVLTPAAASEVASAATVMVECTEPSTKPTPPVVVSVPRISKGDVDAAIGQTLDAYVKGGMTGVGVEVTECYQRASSARAADAAMRCHAMDWVATGLDQQVAQASGWDGVPFHSPSSMRARIREVLASLGYGPHDTASAMREWERSIASAWAAYQAQLPPPDRR